MQTHIHTLWSFIFIFFLFFFNTKLCLLPVFPASLLFHFDCISSILIYDTAFQILVWFPFLYLWWFLSTCIKEIILSMRDTHFWCNVFWNGIAVGMLYIENLINGNFCIWGWAGEDRTIKMHYKSNLSYKGTGIVFKECLQGFWL